MTKNVFNRVFILGVMFVFLTIPGCNRLNLCESVSSASSVFQY